MKWLILKINIKIFKGDKKMKTKQDKHIKTINNNPTPNIIKLVFLNNQVLRSLHIVYLNYKQKLNHIFDILNIINMIYVLSVVTLILLILFLCMCCQRKTNSLFSFGNCYFTLGKSK